MKVLLLGEFSSLHRYLKDGLKEMGLCDVLLASNGDSWKKIPGSDMNLFEGDRKECLYKNIYNTYIYPLALRNEFKNNDVIQFINPRLYSPLINEYIVNKLISNNRVISLVAAGDDLALVNAYKRGLFDYYSFDYDKHALRTIYNKNTIKGYLNIRNDINLANKADLIIPSLYEYYIGYKERKNIQKVIPFPINVDAIKYKDNIIKSRIVFFHGLNRELAKGSLFIKKALERLKESYPNDVDVVIDGHMPFNQYIEIIRNSNVIVDQCCGYGYGINACISMAQGKVVISGCRRETLNASGIEEAPIINAKPDVDYLYKQMCCIVENRHRITEWGYRSRKFIENHHDYKKIAFEYYKLWTSKLKSRL